MSSSMLSDEVLEIVGLFRDYVVRIVNGWVSVESAEKVDRIDDFLSRSLIKYIYSLGEIKSILKKDSQYYIYLEDSSGRKITVYIEKLKT